MACWSRLGKCAAPWIAVIAATGCVIDDRSEPNGSGGSGGSAGSTATPIGPVASNASEAWPDRPDVPKLGDAQIAEACVAQALCNPGPDPLLTVQFCIGQLTWSAERAIPISNLQRLNERVEYLVPCVLENKADCSAVAACSTSRDAAIACQEDGCRVLQGQSFDVTCDGTIATLTNDERSFSRDCARALAECDPTSATGCTDRPFTACPADVGKADRCDGNVRLGCDGAGQVSYHDCERMSGVCGTTSEGKQDCIYTDPPDAACADPTALTAQCEGAMLAVCVNGARVVVAAGTLCASG